MQWMMLLDIGVTNARDTFYIIGTGCRIPHPISYDGSRFFKQLLVMNQKTNWKKE